MKIALCLLGLQGLIGAFDTLYYHEWRARLPARGGQASRELVLHAARDFLYAILFCALPWLCWSGAWTVVVLAVFAAEIVLTLWDFVVEIAARKDLGDVYAGERVTHAVMGILYGAMLAMMIPTLHDWWLTPTGLAFKTAPIPGWTCITLSAMGVGVLTSGFRDLYAALALPGGAWPWKAPLRRIGDVREHHALMERLKHIDARGPYSRDEMNER